MHILHSANPSGPPFTWEKRENQAHRLPTGAAVVTIATQGLSAFAAEIVQYGLEGTRRMAPASDAYTMLQGHVSRS